MFETITPALLTSVLVAMLAGAIPLMLSAVGETIGEQSGVLNIGLEGVLLTGGYFAFSGTLVSGSFWFGFVCGIVAGMLLASIMMVLSVWFGLNQIVVGIGITLAGVGLTSMLYESNFAASRPRLGLDTPWRIPLLAEIPVLGQAVFSQPGMFTVAILLVVATSVWMYRTTAGLRLRAAGQRPESLDLAGGNVTRIRSLAVLFGGAMSGLGGAYLALISAGTFTPGMTHGLGFLAIVVAMLARGRLLWVALIALAYGALVATGTALQLANIDVPIDVIQIAPFVIVMIFLAAFAGRSSLPAALASSYTRGQR